MNAEIGQTARLVEGLASQAQDIGKVLDVIRAIAEQTNLLAPQCRHQAARAGEQGRGFAVVADEVRALAHRTQQSTHEIEGMIASVREGTDTAVSAMRENDQRARQMLDEAEAADHALGEIAEHATRINERTLVIASAAEEQAHVAREVDRNLVNIRDVAVQTTQGAEQTRGASHELSRLANDSRHDRSLRGLTRRRGRAAQHQPPAVALLHQVALALATEEHQGQAAAFEQRDPGRASRRAARWAASA